MQNIVEMIRQIGRPVKLETVISWNPLISKVDIESCKDLEIMNNMVSIESISVNIEDLTYHQLLELIHEYNEKVKEEFTNYDETKLKISAIKKWLANRYGELIELDSSEMYESFEVKKNGNSYYTVICNDYMESTEKALLQLFNDEDLTIYYISKSFESQVNYFSFTNANRIITKNIDKYIINSEKIEIFKIEKEEN